MVFLMHELLWISVDTINEGRLDTLTVIGEAHESADGPHGLFAGLR